jgi:hypothetical protein
MMRSAARKGGGSGKLFSEAGKIPPVCRDGRTGSGAHPVRLGNG